eukprot:TRINITY_DN10878_c0_g1_i2.p1 TRINITY_DN10878_c0_g1~~TRINITY_DN10878_c0_g1_i2.p1  ORF type:complete len:150 (+),score=13.24 TRINITY_DN10878_c0_g1_i2:115-564(+)
MRNQLKDIYILSAKEKLKQEQTKLQALFQNNDTTDRSMLQNESARLVMITSQLKYLQRQADKANDRREDVLVNAANVALKEEGCKHVFIPWGAVHLPIMEGSLHSSNFKLVAVKRRRFCSFYEMFKFGFVSLFPDNIEEGNPPLLADAF